MPADPNRRRVAIRYRAEDNNYYSVVTSYNHALAIGATGALAGDPPLPARWKTRKVNLYSILAGHDRGLRLVAPDKTAAVWTGGTNTVTVQPFGAMPVTGRSGEKRTQGAPNYDGVGTPPNERVSIDYISDNGLHYTYTTTRSHAFAVQAVAPTGGPQFPHIWTPRHIDVVNEDLTGRDQRKVLVAPDPTKAFYTADTAFVFNVNGVNYDSTGRIEESRPNGAPSFVP